MRDFGYRSNGLPRLGCSCRAHQGWSTGPRPAPLMPRRRLKRAAAEVHHGSLDHPNSLAKGAAGADGELDPPCVQRRLLPDPRCCQH